MTTNQIIANLAESNRPEYNYLKLIEEMAELNEVLIKSVTKGEGRKPPVSKIIEEGAHVYLRLRVLSKMLNIDKAINAEVDGKAQYLNDFYRADQYVGGL